MSFNTTRLQDDRVVITGSDTTGHDNKTVVDGAQWFELKGDTTANEAVAEFDQALAEFYAPLTAAADKLQEAKAGKVDALNFIVVQEGEAGKPATSEVIVQLSHDSKILRLIDEDPAAPRLIWVASGDKVSLEILAEAPVKDFQPTAGITLDPSLNGGVPTEVN